MNKILLPILFLITLVSSTYYGYQVYNQSLLVEQDFKNNAKEHYINDKLEYVEEKYKEKITSSFTNNINKIKSIFVEPKKLEETTNIEKVDNKSNMLKSTYIYYSILALFLLCYFIVKTKFALTLYISFLLLFSIVCWIIGILAPILTVEVFKELPILDYTVLKYESKGVFSTIEKLWKVENYIIAIAVGLFSVVLPIIKTIAMYIGLYYEKVVIYIDKLGKWSMADVFVVSVLLAILSINSDEFTKSEAQIGLYFFGTYVILSLFASILIHKKIEMSKKEVKED